MLFFPNFKEEGPGIPPDAPRKKGFARFAELLGRDGLDLFRAGFLALLGCLPFLGGVIYACAAHSMALAPLLGLSDVIVDIVETGTTLRENNLAVLTEFMPVSARFIANRASFQFKRREIETLLNRLTEGMQNADT